MTMERYDVLQVRWPDGPGWQDFCTLRDWDDFALARAHVATGRTPDGRRAEFRVVRPLEAGRVVLALGARA